MSYRKEVLEEHKTEPYHRMRQMLTFHLFPPFCAVLAWLELGLLGTPFALYILMGVAPSAVPLALTFWHLSERNDWFEKERSYLSEHADWGPPHVFKLSFVPVLALVMIPIFLHKREVHLLRANKEDYV